MQVCGQPEVRFKMAITSEEVTYIIMILLFSGFASMVVNSIFKSDNLVLGIVGIFTVAYIFKLK